MHAFIKNLFINKPVVGIFSSLRPRTAKLVLPALLVFLPIIPYSFFICWSGCSRNRVAWSSSASFSPMISSSYSISAALLNLPYLIGTLKAGVDFPLNFPIILLKSLVWYFSTFNNLTFMFVILINCVLVLPSCETSWIPIKLHNSFKSELKLFNNILSNWDYHFSSKFAIIFWYINKKQVKPIDQLLGQSKVCVWWFDGKIKCLNSFPDALYINCVTIHYPLNQLTYLTVSVQVIRFHLH